MLNHLDGQLRALQKIVERLDRNKLEVLLQDMVSTVKNGGKIIATALGKNVPICEKFIGTLISLGIPSYFLHTNSAVHGDLGAVGPSDLVLVLSKSGETEESIYLYEHLERKGANVYVLTYNCNSTLAKISKNKICLYLEHEGDPWNIVPNNSTIGYLFILQALAMELIDRLQIPLSVFKENHPGGAIGKKLRALGDGR
uniref:SIS domain-containing protein n=1 Tax=Fervidobacterium thailandense TaxID=1008305 RepID=A0A7C5VM82_9BACT